MSDTEEGSTFCWGTDNEGRFVVRVDMDSGSRYVATLRTETVKSLMVALSLWLEAARRANPATRESA